MLGAEVARRVPEANGSVRIWQLERPARGCLHYVVASGPAPSSAIVIDPPRDVERIDVLSEIEAVRGSNFADEIEGDRFGNTLQGMAGDLEFREH